MKIHKSACKARQTYTKKLNLKTNNMVININFF